MKKLLYLILRNSSVAMHTIEEIRKQGFNGTVLNTESVRHLQIEYPENKHFYNLNNYEAKFSQESILCLFVVNEEHLDELKEIIRTYTNAFNDIKGCMFSRSISDFEGSI